MIDIKKIKKELLDTFNDAGAKPEAVMKEDALDSVLRVYFSKGSHMPKQLTFEAIMNSLEIEKHDKELSRRRVQEVLDKYSRRPDM